MKLPIFFVCSFIGFAAFAAENVNVEIAKVQTSTKVDDGGQYCPGGRYIPETFVPVSTKQIMGFDKDGHSRIIVTITTNAGCDGVSTSKTSMILIAKSGVSFRQDNTTNLNALLGQLKKATAECPLTLEVSSQGKLMGSQFGCNVFSSNNSAESPQPHQESDEVIGAPAI